VSKLLPTRGIRIAGLVLLVLLSLVPLRLLALPYGRLDWVEYDPAYRLGHSHPIASPTASAAQIPCAELPGPEDPLAAVVNGQEIGRAAFDRELEQFLLSVQAGGADVAGPEVQDRLPEFRRQVLELLIEDVLVQQAAVELGIGVAEESIEAYVATQVEEGGGLELFQAYLEQTGQSAEEFRRDACQELLRAQVQAAVTGTFTGTVEVVHARQIVVADREQALQVLARLASGELFDEVARAVSLDEATREQGGDLGHFAQGRSLAEPQVEALAFAGRQGQVQGPVEVSGGYALVQTVAPAEEALDVEGQALLFEQWLADRRQTAEVEVFVDVGGEKH